MKSSFANWIIVKLSEWLLKNEPALDKAFYSNFDDICKKAQIGDVILVEGRNKISTIIRHVTQSSWTHSALYIGRLNDIEDLTLRELAKPFCKDDMERQLLIESEIGMGTIITPLTFYKDDNLRVLRPQALTSEDAQKIVNFAIGHLGMKYDLRHLLDLARFLFPWGFYPRKWRSSLFEHNALQPTKDICSSMIADAFQSVQYPILPLVEKGYLNEIEFIQRNNRLYTPRDFDYSPYFDVIKYAFFPLNKKGAYHTLPWMKNVISDDEGLNFHSLVPEIQQFFTSPCYAVIGASSNRTKFGNKVLRCYLQQQKIVYPVNPHETIIEGIPVIHQLANLPKNVKSISVVTPPAVTVKIVEQAIKKGINNIWMQPGAESDLAIQLCQQHHINVIADGTCILKELRFRE